MKFDVSIFTSLSAIERLHGEWGALCDANDWLTPFQRPEWCLAWARHFVRGPVRLVTVRARGELVCVLPLFLCGADHERQLRLFGDGLSDHLDAVVTAGWSERAVASALDALRDLRDEWDACYFPQLRPCSTLALLEPNQWIAEVEAGEPYPALAVPAGARAIERLIHRNMLENLRRARRRAARTGDLLVQTSGLGEVDAALDDLFRLHAARWTRRSETGGVFEDATVQAFHRDAALGLARAGILRLHRVCLDGRTIAAIYGMIEHGRLHLYAQGFDPDFPRISPGVLAIGAAMEDGIASGVREVDFLRGREPYKYGWGAVDHATVQRRVWHA